MHLLDVLEDRKTYLDGSLPPFLPSFLSPFLSFRPSFPDPGAIDWSMIALLEVSVGRWLLVDVLQAR